MTCATCIRFSPRPIQGSRYGFCRWPGLKPEPYWRVGRPDAVVMVPQTAGADCAAFRGPKR